MGEARTGLVDAAGGGVEAEPARGGEGDGGEVVGLGLDRRLDHPRRVGRGLDVAGEGQVLPDTGLRLGGGKRKGRKGLPHPACALARAVA